MRHCKRPNSPQSAEIIAGNDDLLTEIILNLPAKSLLRFQSVSKRWRSLISEPYFHRLHAHHCRRRKLRPTFIFCLTPPRFSSFHLGTKILRPFDFKAPYNRILHSCNGLLLLECRNFQYGIPKYCVYNPTTRKQSRIVPINYHGMHMSGLCLAFDPSKSLDYRIVGLWRQGSICKIEVFDSGTQKWTCIRDSVRISDSFPRKFSNGIYRNNAIYWIRLSSESVYLDLESGNFRTPPWLKIPRPQHGVSKHYRKNYVMESIPRLRHGINKNYVMESNGHIHCVSIYDVHDTEKKYLVVFELLDDDSAWFEKYRVDLNPVAEAFPEMDFRTVAVVGIVRGSGEDDCLILLYFGGKVVCYRVVDDSFEVVLDLNDEGGPSFLFQPNSAYQFMESLIAV